jgi:amidase
MADELIAYDAVALGELIRKGEIKATELLEITIQQIERVNPKLNCVIHKMYDQARSTAEEWDSGRKQKRSDKCIFGGVPFLLKDLLAESKDNPFHEGSAAVRGYVSKLDSELVKRQKAAGLIIVGKTNTPEFGLLPTTEPDLYGPTVNPWDPSLSTGGSSGGSASAVASGIVPMAHGNDAGGSIRIPASCCGLFGLKPTRGRNPLGPTFGDIGSGIVCEHAVTRTVRDSAALLDATAGPDIGDPYCAPPKERPFLEEVERDAGRLKIGLLTAIPDGWGIETRMHPDCENAVRDAASLCESLGHIVEEIKPDELGFQGLYKIFGIMFTCLVGRFIAFWETALGKKLTKEQMEPITWATYQAGLKRTGADYLGAVETCHRFSRKIAGWHEMAGNDIILSPTICIPPIQLGAFQLLPEDPMRWAKISNTLSILTYIYNITGQPAMSVPLFWNEGNAPIGVQFAGRFGNEATLFRLAAQLEQARPWTDRKPLIHCSNPEIS